MPVGASCVRDDFVVARLHRMSVGGRSVPRAGATTTSSRGSVGWWWLGSRMITLSIAEQA